MDNENKKLVIFDFNGVLNAVNLKDTIISLSENYILAIVSSSFNKYISDFLTKEGIGVYFSDILGLDNHKSKVIKINILLKKYNILPKDAVFITDSLYDILDGNGCGVRSIGVTWGLHHKKELDKGNPVTTIDNPRDLLDSIQNVLK